MQEHLTALVLSCKNSRTDMDSCNQSEERPSELQQTAGSSVWMEPVSRILEVSVAGYSGTRTIFTATN
jgi:hypothetical protein